MDVAKEEEVEALLNAVPCVVLLDGLNEVGANTGSRSELPCLAW